ncbi:MAG: TonB-dependent receptor plug domain-containing protein, partial [Rubritalea sp.]|uniref:TonB-dependent receptor plug domain-containing protein n=1 Tax=Rubritalea sp. TaxID=2109375 RepID=UPI003242C2AE
MKNTTNNNLVSGKQVVAGLIAVSQCAAQAQEAKVQLESLEPTTVIASRFENPLDKTSSSVSILTGEGLERTQQNRFLNAVDDLAGVQALSTAGQTGSIGTVIVRGLPTRYNQVVVDGVRVTESNNSTGVFLGAAQTNQVSQLEVLRGPQSVLYGADAAGGVIGITSRLGEDKPNLSLYAEAAPFYSYSLPAATI